MKQVKKPEIRKKELIDIAQKQFMERGYDKTSIRSIVGEAGGEIGMFYHYFTSKEGIFHCVLEQYNTAYVENLKTLIANCNALPFPQLLDAVLSGFRQSMQEYASMQPKNVNAQMLMVLHHNALLAVRPIFQQMLADYAGRGEIQLPNVEPVFLADFLLYGMSAIIHGPTGSMDAKISAVHTLFERTLGT